MRAKSALAGSIILAASLSVGSANTCNDRCVESASSIASATYRVVNLMPEYWDYWDAAEALPAERQLALFRKHFVDKHPGLYSPGVIDTRSPKPFDEGLADLFPQFMQFVGPHIPVMRRLSQSIEQDLPRSDALFRQTFPDFSYTGDVYFFVSLGSFDGATRPVNGQMALLFGIETMAGIYGDELDLQPLFIHELFHVYHRQHFGEERAQDPLYATLWREGLAQYVAKSLVPDADGVSLYGMPPDLPQRAGAMLPGLAAGMLAALDSTDGADFNRYFSFQNGDESIPPRAGYYLGYRVAQSAGRTRSLQGLARMPAAEARPVIEAALRELVAGMLPRSSTLK